jgi:hypothetical protein
VVDEDFFNGNPTIKFCAQRGVTTKYDFVSGFHSSNTLFLPYFVKK